MACGQGLSPSPARRSWVLTFPFQVRRWIAQSSELLSDVIALVNDEIAQFYITHTPGLDEEARESIPATGSITFIQRFNSALALSTEPAYYFRGWCMDTAGW